MRGFLSTALLIFITCLISIQSATPLFHTGLPENISINFAEELGGDEDSDEKEDIDKSVTRATGSGRPEIIPIFHFTGYLTLVILSDFDVVFPPPKA
jgi:hypothetical protein